MQKQYHKRTTLCSKSSTIKGLLYAHDPVKHKKGTLSDQHQLLRVTSTAILCHWGRQSLEDMMSFRTVLSKECSKDQKTKSGASSVSRSGTLEGTLCLEIMSLRLRLQMNIAEHVS
jgi:hypothetical protein